MTERERLIGLLQGAYDKYINLLEFEKSIIATHLLENGVIVPPCKIGDMVWIVIEDDAEIVMDVVEAIHVNQYGGTCLGLKIQPYAQGILCKRLPFEYFGKKVFLTEEEAKNKLKAVTNNG